MSRRLLLLGSLILSSASAWAQLSDNGTEVDAQVKIIQPQEVEFENKLKLEIDNVLQKTLGSRYWSNTFVDAVFKKKNLGSSTTSVSNPNASDQSGLTYSTFDWSVDLDSAVEPPLGIASVKAEVYVEDSLTDDQLAVLRRLLDRLLSSYPADLRIVKVNSASLAKNTPEIEPNANRAPASEEGQWEQLAKKLGPWMPLMLGVLAFLGLLLSSMVVGSAFSKIANSMRQIAAHVVTNGSITRKNDPNGENTPLETDEVSSKELSEDISQKLFDQSCVVFKRYLNNVPSLLSQTLSRTPDQDLRHLAVLVPDLSEEELENLKQMLGGRVRYAAIEATGASVEGYSVTSCKWLSNFVFDLQKQDLFSDSSHLRSLTADDFKLLQNITNEQFDAATDGLEDVALSQRWGELVQVVSPELVEKYLSSKDPNYVSRVMTLMSSYSPSDDCSATLEALRSTRTQESKGDEKKREALQSIFQIFAHSQQKYSLLVSEVNWKKFWDGSNESLLSFRKEIWILDDLHNVPMPVLSKWLFPLDNRLLGLLLHFCDKAEYPGLWARIESGLPEGMRRKIIVDTAKQFERRPPAEEDLVLWSNTLRNLIEKLRKECVQSAIDTSQESSDESQVA